MSDSQFALLNINPVVTTLLTARVASQGSGNRRALFARFDELLASPALTGLALRPVAGTGEQEIDQGSRPVRLRRMRLHNWRSFERAELILSDAGPGRPLFIVGGQNGFGKSSVLEAFAYGLFGRRTFVDSTGLINATASRASVRRSYSSVMERVLHRSDRARSEGWCGVLLDFETPDGRVEIERKWYFDEVGSLIEEDEEVLVRSGCERDLLNAPMGAISSEWMQDEIERLIMSAGLAPFFIFDGEQIERWADRKLSDQVRLAIERVLGLEDLVGLAADLRAYARDRERAFGGEDSASAETLRDRISLARETMVVAKERLKAMEQEVAEERQHREQALVVLAVTSSDSHADMQTFLERGHALAAECIRLRRELGAVLAENGPFALMGSSLAAKVADEVEDEGRHLSVLDLDRAGFEGLWSRFAAVSPPLDRSVAKAMRARMSRAWYGEESVNVRPIVHLHLGGTDHRAVASKLRRARGEGIERVSVLRAALKQVMAETTQLAAEREADERRDQQRGQARRELGIIAQRLESAEEQRRAIERELSMMEASLTPDVEELARREERLLTSAPKARIAAQARAIAEEIELWIESRSADEYERFGAAVTTCFRRLAHKEQIARISIQRDGSVALYDEAGVDVTEYRLSAGENQLFALALIAAVAEVTGRELPLVVDTPLSRLDTSHRAGVLRMLTQRTGQTILLTQPEEIGERHMTALRASVAGTMRISHRINPRSGVGVSEFADGYLEDVAA